MKIMAQSYGISVYGIPPLTTEAIKQKMYDAEHGIVRVHDTTYLEYEIPLALENELSEMIEKKLEEFEKTCQCEDCKENRQNKK